VELVCVVGLIVPSALHLHPQLTVVAAAVLAIESLVFVWLHVKYGEIPPIIMSAVLGLLMAFIADGRMVLNPIFCPVGRLARKCRNSKTDLIASLTVWN
jgi:hypothetical protein